MTAAFIDFVGEPGAALFVELVVVVFRVHGGHGSAGLRDAALGVGQQPRADALALRLGQHRKPRDDVSPGLVGMVGVRIEPASRHGAILVGLAGLAGLNRRGRFCAEGPGRLGASLSELNTSRCTDAASHSSNSGRQSRSRMNTCSRMARAASGSRSYASIRMVMSASVMRHDNRQSAA